MPNNTKPQLRYNCYLLRPTIADPVQALRPAYRPGGKHELRPLTTSADAPSNSSAYFSARAEKVPSWAERLEQFYPGVNQALNMSNRLVIFLEVSRRLFAVCFGYGSTVLDWSAIEPNFGLRFAARRFSSNNINEFRSRRIDASARTQAVQIPRGSAIRELGVDLDGEFVRKLVGELDAGVTLADLGVVVASDSIAFKAEIDLNHIQEVLGQILDVINGSQPHEDLLFVDALEPLRASDSAVKQLETRLAAELFDRPSDQPQGLPSAMSADTMVLEFAPPDDVSIETADRVIVSRGDRQTILSAYNIAGLRTALRDIGVSRGRTALRNVRLIAIGEDGEPASQLLPLLHWLVYETGDAVRRYVLTIGRWFGLNEDYTTQLNADLAKIRNVTAELSLLDWSAGDHEEVYIRTVPTPGVTACLDQVPIYAEDGDQVEACDLLHIDGYLIHIKRYNGSQTLSHLFSQGFVSATLLAADEKYKSDFVAQVQSIDSTMTKTAEAAPRRVTYAIGLSGHKTLPEGLPTFSKVNLRDFAKRLRQAQVEPSLAQIAIT